MDRTLTLWFNGIAEHLTFWLPLFSEQFVYLIFGIGALWIAIHHLGRIKAMAIDFAFTMALPILLSAVICEGLSRIINRDRPFVALSEVKQLIEHGADPSFPSSHMSVMAAIAVALWFRNRNLGAITFVLATISGLARIGAGIHYPSDIFVGALIGTAIAVLTHRLTKELRLRALRS
ncbi:MAG: phosphatase PAP2 family protein [Candidatus Nanopelagicaceae bacterium]